MFEGLLLLNESCHRVNNLKALATTTTNQDQIGLDWRRGQDEPIMVQYLFVFVFME